MHEIPFASETKRMTTLHATPEGVVAHTKGAPEVVLADCTAMRATTGVVPLDADGRARILAAAQAMADRALRVLAVASRSGATPDNAQRDLTFLGLVGMIDPPRAEAREAVRTCETAGITVVMITGDHPVTARAVARELGHPQGRPRGDRRRARRDGRRGTRAQRRRDRRLRAGVARAQAARRDARCRRAGRSSR